jgi:hypothetical protein
MRFEKRIFEKNAAQAAPGGSQGSWIPNISPYKDGAYPRSDANSFLAILQIRRRQELKSDRVSQNQDRITEN